MPKLFVRDRESIQEAVRRFRQLVQRAGIKNEMRRHRRRLRVEVHLPDAQYRRDSIEIERVRDSIKEYVRQHGFVPDSMSEPAELHASWHWGQWFKRIRQEAANETEEIYEDFKEALRRQQIDASGADAFQKRAEASAKLVASLEPFEHAIVRLGDVIIAKAIINGSQRLAVHTLSPKLARALENDPELASDAVAFFRFIDSAHALPPSHSPELLSDRVGSPERLEGE